MRTRTLPRSWSIAIRSIVGLNLLLVALSFTTWFSGNAEGPGFADRLFRSIGGDGFRLDFLYIILSGLFVLIMFFVLLATKPLRQAEKVDAMVCLSAVLSVVAYVHHILFSGLLDFG